MTKMQLALFDKAAIKAEAEEPTIPGKLTVPDFSSAAILFLKKGVFKIWGRVSGSDLSIIPVHRNHQALGHDAFDRFGRRDHRRLKRRSLGRRDGLKHIIRYILA